MSLRDRLRPAHQPAAPDPGAEARAAQALAAQRGRASYSPAPRAGKAATKLLRQFIPPGALGGAMGASELKRRWDEIAGPPFAGKTAPEKLAAGVLTLRAPGALAPFLQQQAPLLIERLNLAGAKIKSIRIEQRAIAPARAGNVRPIKRPLAPTEEAALAQALDGVEDAALKSALLRLGRAVKQG